MAYIGTAGAVIWAAAASIGAGKHWYQQLKPFANQEERERAFKEQVVESGALTHLWPKHVEQYWLNAPAGSVVMPNDCTEMDTFAKALMIGDQSDALLRAAFTVANRKEQKKNVTSDLFTLAHEGTHCVQDSYFNSMVTVESCISTPLSYIRQKQADMQTLPAEYAYMIQELVFDEENHVDALLGQYYQSARVPDLQTVIPLLLERYSDACVSSLHIIPAWSTFQRSYFGKDRGMRQVWGTWHEAVKTYNAQLSILNKAIHAQDTAGVVASLATLGDVEKKLSDAASSLCRQKEQSADEQALRYIQDTRLLSAADKLALLARAREKFRYGCTRWHSLHKNFVNEQFAFEHVERCRLSVHPRCQDRMAWIDATIAQIQPFAVQERAAEQMSLFTDPLHS